MTGKGDLETSVGLSNVKKQ